MRVDSDPQKRFKGSDVQRTNSCRTNAYILILVGSSAAVQKLIEGRGHVLSEKGVYQADPEVWRGSKLGG